VLANHDGFVAKAVDSIYILERRTLTRLIREINPSLADQEYEALALYIGASIAGSTMFVGFEKPWAGELPLYGAIACRALVELAKSVSSDQLKAYGWQPKELKRKWKTPTLLDAREFRALLAQADADDAAALTIVKEKQKHGSKTPEDALAIIKTGTHKARLRRSLQAKAPS
jgi:hypothetical protein